MATEWPIMDRRGPVVGESIVATLEQRLGHSLPEDYRQFLLEVNGGRPNDSNREFPFGVMKTFFSLADPDDDRDLESSNSGIPELPSRDLLYVGYASGARVLLAIAGEQRGQVWLQDTTEPRPEDANPRVLWHDRRDMKKLADSFGQFMRQLGPLKVAGSG